MELGLLFLFGLTITSTAGSALPRPRSLSLPAGGEPRSAALGQKEREESEAAAEPAGGRAKVDGGALRRRARRCTCYTYKDKECVYYCHLDIIWINTPERTVPYGLSNYRGSFRGKRSTGQIQSTFQSSFRCSCLDAHDKQCMQFCRRMQDRRRNGSVKIIDENTVTNLENLSSPEITDQWKRQRRKTNAGKRSTLLFSSRESLEDSEQSA